MRLGIVVGIILLSGCATKRLDTADQNLANAIIAVGQAHNNLVNCVKSKDPKKCVEDGEKAQAAKQGEKK